MSQKTLPFTKMHGAGNDFVVLDNRAGILPLQADWLKRLADRHFGVGADQILVLENAQHPNNDFKYRIFNADGAEVQQCGNGARCFAQYVFEKGFTHKRSFKVETLAGVIEPQLVGPNQVRVNMGPVRFGAPAVPFLEASFLQAALPLGLSPVAQHGLLRYPLSVLLSVLLSAQPFQSQAGLGFSLASMGNPHAVLVLPTPPSDATVQAWGAAIESHPFFPERVNVGFMVVHTPQCVELRVFERGVGETLACGTGACAAVACGQRLGLLQPGVEVHKKGGVLTIEWGGQDRDDVFLIGPANTVFEGEYYL